MFLQRIFEKRKIDFKKVLLLICLISSNASSYCQNNKVQIIQSEKLDSLFVAQSTRAEKWLSGYRLLIASSSENTKIDSLKLEINHLYPKIETYVLYSKEGFHLLIGDYWNEIEALEAFAIIKPLFPNAFIFKSPINW